MSDLKEKILLSLLAGVAFGCSVTPRQQSRVLKEFGKIWGCSDNKKVSKELANLKKSDLVKKIIKKNGTYILELTDKGKLKAVEYLLLKKLTIKDKKWDGKWRMVIFDVPEKLRNGRNSLRWKIKKLGFYELQKSVFVIPYECKKEIDFIVDFYEMKPYVHYGILEIIGKEINEKLMEKFGIKK